MACNERVHETIGATNSGVLKRLLFLRHRAQELSIEGSRLASLWFSLLTISLNNSTDNDSRLSKSVGIPALSIASQYDKLGKIIRMARLCNTFDVIRQTKPTMQRCIFNEFQMVFRNLMRLRVEYVVIIPTRTD